jgi:hypothetical protein
MEIAMYLPTNSNQDEARLIQAAGKGNIEAFNQLVLKYQSLAYHHAYSLLGDAPLAEDVTQETFIKVFHNIHAFRSGSFRSWLLPILTNIISNPTAPKLQRRLGCQVHIFFQSMFQMLSNLNQYKSPKVQSLDSLCYAE